MNFFNDIQNKLASGEAKEITSMYELPKSDY